MPEYAIVFARSAKKELEKLPTALSKRIFPHIENLALNPRPARSAKLKGERDLWRLRIGDYRVIYRIDDLHRMVDVTIIRHRRDVYR